MFALFIAFITFIVIFLAGCALCERVDVPAKKLVFAVAIVGAGCVFLSLDVEQVDKVQQWLDSQERYRLKSVDEILDSLDERQAKWSPRNER